MSNYEYTLFGFIKQAAPDPGTFSISKDDLLGVDKPRMNAHFKRTGADNVRSEMDRWKTIMAERGYGNMSNRDYRKWKKNPNKLYKLLAATKQAPAATPAAKVPTAPTPDPAPTPGQAPVAAPTATPAPAPTPAPTPDPTPAPAQTPGQAPAPASVVAPVATPSPAPTPASGAALIDASVFNSVPTYTPAPKPNFTPDSIHIPGMTVIRDDSGMTSQERFDKALSDQSKLVSELQAGYAGDPQNAELKAKYDAEKDKANVLRTVSNLNSLQLPTESMNEVQLNELDTIQNALQYSYQKFVDDPNNEENYADLKNTQQAYSEFLRHLTSPQQAANNISLQEHKPVDSSSALQEPISNLQNYVSTMTDLDSLGAPNMETFIDSLRNESLYDFASGSDNSVASDALPELRKRILYLYDRLPDSANDPNSIYELGNLIAAYEMKQREEFNKAPGKYNHIIQAPIDSNTFRQAVENAAVDALNYGVSL